MADNAPPRLPPGNPFLSGEPGTHPAFSANATPEQQGPSVTAQFVPTTVAPIAPGSARAVTPAPSSAGELTDAQIPGLFAMTDPSGQGGGTEPPPELRPPIAPSTYTDPTQPVPLPTTPPADLTKQSTAQLLDVPVEYPIVKDRCSNLRLHFRWCPWCTSWWRCGRYCHSSSWCLSRRYARQSGLRCSTEHL